MTSVLPPAEKGTTSAMLRAPCACAEPADSAKASEAAPSQRTANRPAALVMSCIFIIDIGVSIFIFLRKALFAGRRIYMAPAMAGQATGRYRTMRLKASCCGASLTSSGGTYEASVSTDGSILRDASQRA
jgi:hypothetical protein